MKDFLFLPSNRQGICRLVGIPAPHFQTDPLLMFRTIQTAAQAVYDLAPETKSAITEQAGLLASLPPEQLRTELEKLLLIPEREKAFRLMAETGMLRVILPEADAMRGVTQPVQFHPEGDVFEHTMLMLSHIACPTPALVWSVLLHDIAKPVTRTEKDGIPHFYGHEAVGAGMAQTILERLKAPEALTLSVTEAVRNHMRFAHVDKMRPAKWRRIASAPNFPLELELHRIDCISCHGLLTNYYLMLDRLKLLKTEKKAKALPPPLLTGSDLIRLGMKPGPAMGILLRELMEKQLQNEISTRPEAEHFARQEIYRIGQM